MCDVRHQRKYLHSKANHKYTFISTAILAIFLGGRWSICPVPGLTAAGEGGGGGGGGMKGIPLALELRMS